MKMSKGLEAGNGISIPGSNKCDDLTGMYECEEREIAQTVKGFLSWPNLGVCILPSSHYWRSQMWAFGRLGWKLDRKEIKRIKIESKRLIGRLVHQEICFRCKILTPQRGEGICPTVSRRQYTLSWWLLGLGGWSFKWILICPSNEVAWSHREGWPSLWKPRKTWILIYGSWCYPGQVIYPLGFGLLSKTINCRRRANLQW